jgi:ATP-binding cassette subfamily B protein
MGFWDGLETEGYDRQYSDRVLFQRILTYLKPHLSQIVIISSMVVTSAVFAGLSPIVVSHGLDLVKQNNPNSSTNMAFLVGGAVALIGVLSWVCNWVRRRQTAVVVADISIKLATDAFEAAMSHDLSFYDEYSSGRVLSRITSDTRDFSQLIQLATDITALFFEAGIISVVMFYTNWQLSLLLFVLMPSILLLGAGFRRLARKVTSDGMRAVANVNATIKESISGIAVAKNFRQEMTVYRDFEDANRNSFRFNLRRGLVLALVIPSVNGVWGVIYGIMIYSGGLGVTQALITLGAWYLFILAQDRFVFPLLDLASYWSNIQAGLSATERIFALVDATQAVKQTDSQPVAPLKGRVEFEHVSFRYKDEEPVLEDFSITIPQGENLAIVGHTGAGKSSIAKLIARFYEFQSGRILIDGKDIRTFDLGAYRSQLGIVSQVPFLFNGTVVENIRYACPDVSENDIVEMAKKIGDGEWLEALPDGLDTQVGERGAFLSMGQRQLVSLMRVLVQQPAIFILDEATASIDPFTEWQIQQGLNLILSRTTSILIAHRLSTIKSADRIIVLQSGKILEQGSHDNLLTLNGHYATLYNTYFRHQSLEYIEQSHQLVAPNTPES